MRIVNNGKPAAVVVLGPDATEPERFAAQHFVEYIQNISGAVLPITDEVPNGGTRIYIGQTNTVKKLLRGFDWNRLRRDGILIRTTGRDLIISGDRPRGSIYAVLELLESKLGVRWWTPDTQRVPKSRTINIPNMNVCYTPKLMYREAYYNNVMVDEALFPLHTRNNGHYQQIPPEMGNHYTLIGFVHSFERILLPTAEYFPQHPEWYAFIDGKRQSGYTQMCLSNEEMKQAVIKRALECIRENPDAGMISISQNDTKVPCQCDKCNALVEKYGTQSGLMISFVNDVAEAIEKEYPDFLVETLAYQYTRKAPKTIKPRDNVIVRLCSIECDFGKPITDKANAKFYNDLCDWSKIAKRLYVWHYTVDFHNYIIPHPNFSILGPDLRSFVDNNVIGMLEQGDRYNRDANMYPLKLYLLSKLMWNPYQPEIPIIKEFLDGYYGAAGKPLFDALMYMESVRKRAGIKLGCFIGNADYLTYDDLVTYKRLYDQAEAAVRGDEALLRRVQIQRLTLDLLLITSRHRLAKQNQEIPGVDWSTIVDRYTALCKDSGNDWPKEYTHWDDSYYDALKKAAAPLTEAEKAN